MQSLNESALVVSQSVKRLFDICFVAAIAFLFARANAQVGISNLETMSSDSIEAAAIRTELVFDGNLDEPEWKVAQKISSFTQRELDLGQPITEKTEVAILIDDEHLYIGVWCFDREPDKIIAKEMRRDFDFGLEDNFMVIIDTYLDHRNGFLFVINPNGARADLQTFNNGGSSNQFWNGVWDVRTKITHEGWFAEIKIPFYTLKYRPGAEEQLWGINFERNIRRNRQQARWKGWQRNYDISDVSQAGVLKGLKNLRDKRYIEIKPYGLGGGENTSEGTEGVGNIGGDINALLGPTYRLNLTFNTDFAQVEADRQQINLTRFPLFFPELREFFLEGDDFFDFGFGGNRIIPFYTRRIGLSETRETVPIIAGARILGKEEKTTLGAMSIQTADAGGDPSANFTTLSWRQDVGNQSVIGAMTTNKIVEGRWHTTTGVNGRYSTARFLGQSNLDIGGAFIQTYNTDEGYNADAFAYRAFVSLPNDFLNVFASFQQSPAPFDPEVGLMRRRNFQESFGQVFFQPRPTKSLKWIRQFYFSPLMLTYTQYDDSKELQSFSYKVRLLGFETRSGEGFFFDVERVAEGLKEDFEIFPDVVIPKGEYWWNRYNFFFETFEARAISLETRGSFGEFFEGNSFSGEGTLLWRATKNFNINLNYEKNIVNLPEGSFDTDLIGSRIAYAFHPHAFGSLLGQWNSAQQELNINFRLQLIPKIGTDFFLIFNQIVDTQTGDFISERSTLLAKLVWRFVL
ncbi:MAG TPA: hypothetical protein DDX92_07560 [Flavobacteriales bacterium]|jgi:hypothetical protein|nr:hypothetical protein [Flavobacteriales bacterium]